MATTTETVRVERTNGRRFTCWTISQQRISLCRCRSARPWAVRSWEPIGWPEDTERFADHDAARARAAQLIRRALLALEPDLLDEV